jgi:hypothetical protein
VLNPILENFLSVWTKQLNPTQDGVHVRYAHANGDAYGTVFQVPHLADGEYVVDVYWSARQSSYIPKTDNPDGTFSSQFGLSKLEIF